MDDFKIKFTNLHLSCSLFVVQPGKNVNMAKCVDVECATPSAAVLVIKVTFFALYRKRTVLHLEKRSVRINDFVFCFLFQNHKLLLNSYEK